MLRKFALLVEHQISQKWPKYPGNLQKSSPKIKIFQWFLDLYPLIFHWLSNESHLKLFRNCYTFWHSLGSLWGGGGEQVQGRRGQQGPQGPWRPRGLQGSQGQVECGGIWATFHSGSCLSDGRVTSGIKQTNSSLLFVFVWDDVNSVASLSTFIVWYKLLSLRGLNLSSYIRN